MRECAAQVDVDWVGEFAVTIRKAIVAVGGNARWILHSLTHLTGNRHAYGQIHIIYVVHLCGDAKGRFSTRKAHHTVGQETVVGAHASPYVSHQTLLVLLFQPHIGYDYDVSAYITKMPFNTRVYENFTLPAGTYDALRIIIGSGSGHNWWCVLYPSLCLGSAQENDDKLQATVNQGECDILTDSGKYEVKFKIVEIFESIQNLFSSR